ncbi:hypothetical protein LAZ67_2001301 [Cordylochernes scorpioides]|uniref:Chitin-binding type-2 domain-containing protein n=1 Tax=Cordylochernes scorpioides TaxID=51811 RepID=A0ABY6K409_9ARAC|nr:hypothetical protein LAZ67_2001301 [Cordylochernes scorpioides]
MIFKMVPAEVFTCAGRPPGYYADVRSGCAMYHTCNMGGGQHVFTCPNGTLFHQEMLVCNYSRMVNCTSMERRYKSTAHIFERHSQKCSPCLTFYVRDKARCIPCVVPR